MAAADPEDEIRRLLHVGFTALTEGRLDAAENVCRRVLALDQRRVAGHFLVGLIANERRDRKTAVSAFGSVTRLQPKHVAAWSQLARQLVQLGQPGRAEQALAQAVAIDSDDPVVLDLIGTVCSALGDQIAAEHWYRRATIGSPTNAGYHLNLATSLIFLGRGADAQHALGRALEVEPEQPQAHWLLAGSRPATSLEHIAQLERLTSTPGLRPQANAFLSYAAGKEYEDLERWSDAFTAFERGARAKRSIVDYDEAAEQSMFDALERTFSAEWSAKVGSGCADPAPIFVIGQPRTGTTLIERIISSHSAVHSAGELQQFGLSVRRIVDIPADRLSADVVAAAAAIEPQRLGETYMAAVASLRGRTARFVDKLPLNFLYLPLIATALPRAKIVHVVRDPIDSCFACYKQLFADAYHHSYDQREMARHHVRYRRLMSRWRELLPGRFIDVVYEDVVANFEREARRLIDHLELPWQDACLDFHRQSAAVTTASAVQVREPVYARSVARWRRYEHELAPMIDVLRHAGIV